MLGGGSAGGCGTGGAEPDASLSHDAASAVENMLGNNVVLAYKQTFRRPSDEKLGNPANEPASEQ
jgi:hypothetical protein